MVKIESEEESTNATLRGTEAPEEIEQRVKRLSYELPLENELHPFLVQQWDFRSVLNEHSPLLKTSMQKRIADLGGWPASVNDKESIKEVLCPNLFNIVSEISLYG